MPNDARVRALLGDLGRATLRGVRKCPKCGTYNGTRGSSCKNRACDVVFNNRGLADKQNKPIDACKLITGGSNQLYSVRVREKGPDFRGFVHIPQNLDSAASLDGSSDALSMLSSQAQCFVENCQRSYDDKGGYSSLQLLPCNHIQAAVRCYAQAQPLHIKHEILQTLILSQEVKQAIWLLQSESESPLVQRVSKNMMVCRCKPSPKCPLGYVHLSIFSTKIKDRVEHKYCCACKAYDNMTGKVPGKNPNEKQCLHYYSCISAFSSDLKLADEFSMYVSLLMPQSINIKDALEASKLLVNQLPIEQIVAVVTKQTADGSPQEVSFQVLSDNSLLGTSSLSLTEDGQISEVHALEANLDVMQMKMVEQDESLSFSSLESQLLDRSIGLVDVSAVKKGVSHLDLGSEFILHDVASARTHPPEMQISTKRKTAAKRSATAPTKKLCPLSSVDFVSEPLDESLVYQPFLEWLASVTERVNETMHYESSGQPSPVIFHVPHIYFYCLKERISNGGKKKRIPTVTSVQRPNTPMPRPGNYIKYTWQITNIIQVKKIFDTPQVLLDITRSFVENKDGSFDHFVSASEEEKNMFARNMPLIRPLELKTYLKVGLTAPEQKEPTPFIIDWIPDVFPRTRLGEMSLTFEFGHQRLQQHISVNPDMSKKMTRPQKIICAKRKMV